MKPMNETDAGALRAPTSALVNLFNRALLMQRYVYNRVCQRRLFGSFCGYSQTLLNVIPYGVIAIMIFLMPTGNFS